MIIEVDEREKEFIEQATRSNFYDQSLLRNAEKVRRAMINTLMYVLHKLDLSVHVHNICICLFACYKDKSA